MSDDLKSKCRQLLLELEIVSPTDPLVVRPLTGGVASDIALVSSGERKFCVKFALAKLKVQRDWFAPVHRNAAEYAWLQVAASVAPNSAITLFGRSDHLHGFAMEFLEGDDVFLWKDALLAEHPVYDEAAKVGDLLGRIHTASVRSDFDPGAFHNRADFHALRIEPYLLFTAEFHPAISDSLQQMADQLDASAQVLVHGDVSPKNIVFRAPGPVLLDAECATMGDASFDPSFCMNHLILKSIHKPNSKRRYLEQAIKLWQSYSEHVSWEPVAELERRVCRLLPCLMLARIDGKSPVEYLTGAEKVQARHIAHHFIKSPVGHLQDLINGICNFPAQTTQ